MASSVYYKFKSQRDESRVTFDGTGISVFDLKREIILQNSLKAQDIDLLVFDSANQEYKDDSHIIPRSTSVIAKRMPAIRPGRGKAAIYVAGVAPSGGSDNSAQSNSQTSRANAFGPAGSSSRYSGTMSKRFDGRDEKPGFNESQHLNNSAAKPQSSAPVGDDEAASIAAMFAATTEQWEETQEQMAHERPIYNRTNAPRKPFAARPQPQHAPDSRPIPPGYICHRCSKKGHWIQDCPTNDDREFDNRPRIKRTTGIPKSFLQSVELPSSGTGAHGIMVTPEGGYVRAQPDSAAWQRHVNRPKALTETEVREKPPSNPALACPYPDCGKLFRRAIRTPCCGTTYCEECAQSHLLEKDFECPKCKAKIASLDKLIVDKEMRAKVKQYIDDAIEESKKEEGPVPDEQNGQASKPTTDPTNSQEEEYSEHQPGNEINGGQYNNYGNEAPFDPHQAVTQLQAQLAQIMLMMQNPTLPPTSRMQFQMQIQTLTAQLQQAEMIAAQAAFGGMNMAMMNNMVGGGGMGMMGGGGVGMMGGPGMNNMGGFGGMPPHQPQQWNKPGWINPHALPPAGGDDSAYQRLPVNNRRKNLKRDRPEDFLEMNDNKRQYWE